MIGYLAAQRMAKKKPAGGDLNIAQQKVDSDIPEIKSNFLSGSAPTRPVAPPMSSDEWNPSLQAFPQYKRVVNGYDNEGNELASFEITGYTDQSGNKVDDNLVKSAYKDSGENTTMGYMFSGAPTPPPINAVGVGNIPAFNLGANPFAMSPEQQQALDASFAKTPINIVPANTGLEGASMLKLTTPQEPVAPPPAPPVFTPPPAPLAPPPEPVAPPPPPPPPPPPVVTPEPPPPPPPAPVAAPPVAESYSPTPPPPTGEPVYQEVSAFNQPAPQPAPVAAPAPTPAPTPEPVATPTTTASPTMATATTSNIDPTIQPYLSYGLSEAQKLYQGGGPQYYGGQTYVSPSEQTQTGLQALEQRASKGSPLTGAAQSQLQGTIQGNYLSGNPFFQGAFNPAAQAAESKFKQSLGDIGSAASKAGRYGSGAMSTMQQGASGQFAKTLADTAGTLAYQNYSDERGRQQAATMAAPTMAQADYADIQNMLSAGKMREGYTGAQQQADIDKFNFQQQQPQQNLANFLSGVYGNPMGKAGAVSNVQQPSGWQNLLGTAATLSGIENQTGWLSKGWNALTGQPT
jgi:hypothetical protein